MPVHMCAHTHNSEKTFTHFVDMLSLPGVMRVRARPDPARPVTSRTGGRAGHTQGRWQETTEVEKGDMPRTPRLLGKTQKLEGAGGSSLEPSQGAHRHVFMV